MSLVEIFLARGQQHSNSLALRVLTGIQDPPQDYTWGQLAAIVVQVAGGLQASLAEPSQEASQVREPDASQTERAPTVHVATWLPNGLPWIVVDLATQLLHWVHVALDRRLSPHATMQLAKHSRSRGLIVPDAETANQLGMQSVQGPLLVNFAELLQSTCTPYSLDRWPMPSDDQPAQILYTSGTMSQPKGVVLTHGNLTSNARAKLDAAPQVASDIRLNILPFAHAYARTCELSTWIISGSQLCIVNDWNELLRWAPVIRPTLINLVPHLAHKLAGLLDSDSTSGAHILGDRLRLLQVGGAALPLDAWNRLAKVGWAPLQGYGLTETSPVICSNRAGSQRPDSVGYPVLGVELRIDEQGILWTRGPQVMQGYWQEPGLTADKIVDGWFRTDDLAEMADDGSLRIIGRADDQIVLSTGYKVSPGEVTRHLQNDPWIESLVIVGQDRPYIGALVYPVLNNLPEEIFGDRNRRTIDGMDAIEFEKLCVERWQAALKDFPRWMQIRRVGIMPRPLSVTSGGLNFKGGLRRRFVEQQLYANLVALLYA